MDYFHAFGDAQLNLELVEKQHFFYLNSSFVSKKSQDFLLSYLHQWRILCDHSWTLQHSRTNILWASVSRFKSKSGSTLRWSRYWTHSKFSSICKMIHKMTTIIYVFALYRSTKKPLTTPMELFSMSTWALVITQVVNAMLKPTRPSLHLLMSLFFTIIMHLHIKNPIILNPSIIIIRNLLSIITNTMN